MGSWLSRIRDAIKRIYAYSIPLRFSFLALAILLFAFWMSDQGWDIQRALVEDNVSTAPLRIFAFLFVSFLLAPEVWYWSRQMLRFRPGAKQPDDPCRNPITEPLVEDATNPDDHQTADFDHEDKREFRNAHDALAKFGTSVDLRLSTASLMSARFTYVSPAGRVPNRDPHDRPSIGTRAIFGHVVDGGYFENSGGVTAAEIVSYLRRKGGVQPYVIFIDYADKDCPVTVETPYCPAYGIAGPPPSTKVTKFAGEVMSPLYALLDARDARGQQAIGDAVTLNGNVVEFRLIPHTVPLPLGWVLSRDAMAAIDGAMPCDARNRAGISLIGSVIGQPPLPMRCGGQAVPMPAAVRSACSSGRC